MKSIGHVTIEKTAKKFKLQGLLSGLLIFLGLAATLLGGAKDVPVVMAIGLLWMFGGLGWNIVNRIRIWWNHE